MSLNIMAIDPPGYIIAILRRLNDRGYDAFLVGGCVRDAVMGRPVHDWDIATAALPADVARMFPKTVLTGERYGTVTVIENGAAIEVTTFRADGEYRDGRHPENVRFVPSLDADLSRRDFTMNAMAVSAEMELIDPFSGFEDIKNQTIRCVGVPDARFKEDALRMFRAFRFASQLGFSIEPGTLSAILSNADEARRISAERIRIELEKTLMSQRPQIANEIIKARLLDAYLWQGDDSSIPTDRDTSAVDLARIAELPAAPALRWCAFCAVLLEDGVIRSCPAFLLALRHDSKTVKSCSSGAEIAQAFEDINMDGESPVLIKRLLAKHGADAVRCAAAAADTALPPKPTLRGKSALAITDEIIASGECFSLKGLAISGSDLIEHGYAPGPEIKKALNNMLGHVIERPMDNKRDILLSLLE